MEIKIVKNYLGQVLLLSFLGILSSCSSDIADPVFTTGKVYDGSQNTFQYDGGGESKGKTQIKYVYQTKGGKAHKTTETINKDAFDQIFKGQYIQVVYSEKEPHLSVPLIDIATVNKYVDQENRNLELEDIYNLMSIESKKEIEKELNKISFKWSYQKEDSTDLWYNMPFNESIYRTDKETIGYMTRSNSMFMRMRSKMKKAGYEEMLNLGQGHQIWKSDTHLAESNITIDTEGFGRQQKTTTYFAISFIESETTEEEENKTN